MAVTLEVPPAKTTAPVGPRFAVIRFPGSNCDQDAYHAIKDVLNKPVEYVWHQETSLKGYDVIVLPGGFSYGDYLRTGAVARFAPIMEAVRAHAERGGFVMGICNGFQVLCEAHLLPGALIRNTNCKFICKTSRLRVENAQTPFTSAYKPGQTLRVPIAHGEGRYVCDDTTLADLRDNGRILFRYVDASDDAIKTTAPNEGGNPNGSLDDIAGIANANFNVLGMMPHPERACEKILGSADGRGIFESVIRAAQTILK